MGLAIVVFGVLAALIVLFSLFYRFIFLRDPVRTIPPGDTVVSPADGDIAAILDVSEKDAVTIPKGRWGRIRAVCRDVPDAKKLILIVMNVWHVHVQRAPIRGRITRHAHKKGRFVNAVADAASFITIENERTETVFTSPQLTVKTLQIAGVLARRIESFVKEGDRVMKGQRFGRIVMGSQVALIVPGKVKLRVREGDSVLAGETVVGEW